MNLRFPVFGSIRLGILARLLTLCSVATLLTASCGAAPGAEPQVRIDTFSNLKRGDTLVVLFHSSGCFHDATHEFTFHRGTELTVSIVQLPGSALARPFIAQTNRVALGTLTLSKSDVAGLDKLMEFYHARHDSFCTTVDHITFNQQRDGKTVAYEEATDGSCQIYERKDLTRFPDLIGRLSPHGR